MVTVGSALVLDADTVAAGAAFTLSVVVGNTGDAASPYTALRYYHSGDGSYYSSATTWVGTDSVPALAAGTGIRRSIRQIAPRSPGDHYYYACAKTVPGETRTTNNCSPFVTVTVLQGSDLVVGSPTVSEGSPAAGAAFTLSATVSNMGEAASPSTTLRYYRVRSDTPVGLSVGTDAVPELLVDGTSDQSVSLTAPTSPGIYYYYACVNAVTGEMDTTNNCTSFVWVRVPPMQQLPVHHPDLVVGPPTVNNNTPWATGRFTVSATVSNTGDRWSPATTLRYYRSTDAAITRSDTEEGTAGIPVYFAGGTDSVSIALTAPASPGIWYYGACVDEVTGESDTTNNCSLSVTVTVQPLPKPDLAVSSPTVGNNSPVATGRFTVSATVSNTGDRYSPATTLRYYRSTDAAITRSDTEEGTAGIPVLFAGGTNRLPIALTAPASPGIWYYGACVDEVTGESDTTNNCSLSVMVTVQPLPKPDLVVSSPAVGNSSPVSTGRFTLSATVSNTGTRFSEATTLRYYRSTDEAFTMSDTEEGTAAIPALNAGGTNRLSISLTAPASSGIWYYGACVDTVTGESATANNCSPAVTVTVRPRVDLVVGSPTVSDSSPAAGGAFTLSATVSNTGARASASTTLRYYRSTDDTITASDTSEGTDAIPALSAAGTSSQSISLTAPASGTWYYGACVDTVTGESDMTNNCSTAVTVNVGG